MSEIIDPRNSEHGIDYTNTELVSKQKEMYNSILSNIVDISEEQKVFAKENNQQLGLLIVEPRSHEWLKAVLYNMAHIYGGLDVPLYIVHGAENKEFIDNIVGDWSNIVFLELPVDNLSKDEYSTLLTSEQFWSYIKTEFVLVFQTDTFIRKKIPEVYYYFDMVSAPWPWSPIGCNNRQVGNGGFSLRKVKTMLNICNKYTYNKENDIAEDVFFCKYVPIDRVPPVKLASQFSVEHIYNTNPVGLHQVWRFQTIHDIVQLTSNVGGIPPLIINKK